MKRVLGALVIVVSLLAFAPLVPAWAEQITEPPITINRFKVISGDQYVELKNNTDAALPMGNIQLAYYNDYDLAKATSSKLISLSGEIPAGGYYLINDSTQTLCYQTAIASVSLGFGTSTGRIQLLQLSQTGDANNPFNFELLDYAGWYRGSTAPPAGIVHFPATSQNKIFALRDWTNAPAKSPGSGAWLKPSAEPNSCTYQIASEAPAVMHDETFAFLTGELPPVRYVAAVSEQNGPVNRNPGKAAPIVNEVLPNPASPQTDADDEFIELYNPNDTVFDLTGFKLAFGSTSPKKYTFPEGTLLQPKEFKAFTSGDTSISLSNTEAQVWLLDPNEQVIGSSDPYRDAKDGQAWVLDSGKWMWTLQPSPNASNTIAVAVTSSEKGKIAAATLGIGTTGGASTGSPSAGSSEARELDDAAPLHPVALAVVGLGAVAYILYEYRQDLSNKLFQLRRYLRNRQAIRKQV